MKKLTLLLLTLTSFNSYSHPKPESHIDTLVYTEIKSYDYLETVMYSMGYTPKDHEKWKTRHLSLIEKSGDTLKVWVKHPYHKFKFSCNYSIKNKKLFIKQVIKDKWAYNHFARNNPNCNTRE
jgi:hypothetical protein